MKGLKLVVLMTLTELPKFLSIHAEYSYVWQLSASREVNLTVDDWGE